MEGERVEVWNEREREGGGVGKKTRGRNKQTAEHLQIIVKPTGHHLPKTQSPLSLRPQYPPTYKLAI